MFGPREQIECEHAQITGYPERWEWIGEEAGQYICRNSHPILVLATLPRIGAQKGIGTRITAGSRGVGQQLGQYRHITDPQIEALASNGMDRVGGIADKYGP